MYNLSEDTWELLPEAPLEARMRHTAVLAGSEMLIWGGDAPEDSRSFFKNGAAFDFESDEWRTLPDAPVARASARSIYHSNRVYIFGGNADPAIGAESIDVFSLKDESWTRLDLGEKVLGLAALNTSTLVAATFGNRGDEVGLLRVDVESGAISRLDRIPVSKMGGSVSLVSSNSGTVYGIVDGDDATSFVEIDKEGVQAKRVSGEYVGDIDLMQYPLNVGMSWIDGESIYSISDRGISRLSIPGMKSYSWRSSEFPSRCNGASESLLGEGGIFIWGGSGCSNGEGVSEGLLYSY
uniref:hypothetical protein n=1 Tax=Nocardiopsis endophytica TaxID=3018445 RepID=UPI0038CD8409